MRECQRCDYECFCGYEAMTNDNNQHAARELLPCPFCHKDRGWLRVNSEQLGPIVIFHTECEHCGARGPIEKNSIEAFAAWNNRPTPPDSGEK